MPHNRTRLWVGLAIVAVTIPAVGTYYVNSTRDNVQNSPIEVAGRWAATNAETRTTAARASGRNYAAQLDALLAKQNAPSPVVQDSVAASDEDDTFNIDLLDADDQDAVTSSENTARSASPDPSVDLTPVVPTTVASSTDVPVVSDPLPQGGDIAQSGDLSDGDVYRIVINNLSAEDRDRFVQAYTAMSPDQRADMLDSFRDQMQNGNGR